MMNTYSVTLNFMPRTTDLLTISLEKKILRKIKQEAKRRKTTVSALLRDAFTRYTEVSDEIYTDQELSEILQADKLPKSLKEDLEKCLANT